MKHICPNTPLLFCGFVIEFGGADGFWFCFWVACNSGGGYVMLHCVVVGFVNRGGGGSYGFCSQR